jgi:hypothetical protein
MAIASGDTLLSTYNRVDLVHKETIIVGREITILLWDLEVK